MSFMPTRYCRACGKRCPAGAFSTCSVECERRPKLTELQTTILKQSAANGGRFVSGSLLISIRVLERRGLVRIEDQGSMPGRGMNSERWLVVATDAGRAALATPLVESAR
jgi:hypothetical protein